MNIFIIFIIAVSLSMDAFSLSLAYGLNNLQRKRIITISVIVGIFHIMMPLLGVIIGNYIVNLLKVDINLIIGIIFLYLSIDMFISTFKKDKVEPINNIIQILLFALGVSLDSFSVGIGLAGITNYIFTSAIIFGICSSSFTYFGFILGKYTYKKLGNISTIAGSVILFIISLFYIIQ